MVDLPLFPLNTVLFPGTPIHLHIFEDRYKLMINRCIEDDQLFGVVLIRQGMEALGPLAAPHAIGSTAKILHVQRLDQGRLNIVAAGQERFRIQSLDFQAAPYLVGITEPYPLDPGDADALSDPGARLRIQLENYIELLLSAGGTFDTNQLPENPVELAYMGAALLQIPPIQKQALLEINEPAILLSEVRRIYFRELALLKVIMQHPVREEITSFSRN